MTDYNTIARPYAQAAFEFAAASKETKLWGEWLALAAAFCRQEKLHDVLTNPQITIKNKITLLTDLLKPNAAQINFLKTLAHYRRLSLLPEISKQFNIIQTQEEKKLIVNIFTVYPLDDIVIKQLHQALQIRFQQEIKIVVHDDKSLLGGLIIKVGDFVIDGSLKTQLQRLKQSLLV